MYSQFTSIIAILIFSAEFCAFLASGIGRESEDAVYYRKCNSSYASLGGIKCVGYPIGCITKRNCVWMGSVIDEGEQLVTRTFHTLSGVLYNTSTQYISGWAFITLDESMTKIVCRRPEMEDVKFFFISNDTQLMKKIDASRDISSVSSGYKNKEKYLENCTEITIPISENPNHVFNLRYILRNYFSGGIKLEWLLSKMEFADSIEYNIDPTKMLYYTKFQEVTTSKVTSSASINIFTTQPIIILCIVATVFIL